MKVTINVKEVKEVPIWIIIESHRIINYPELKINLNILRKTVPRFNVVLQF